MGPVAQRKAQISHGEPRMLTHDGFGARTLAVLDGVDHDAMVLLADDQDLLRLG